ncbi:MAG: XRE family transcriptional regulator [Herpetosiphonaceae bacterium]|nr:XRE family transcriptional regulator [Herpetosiphonaceae bacterium]
MNANILDTIELRELGKELQRTREKRGMTQQEAAEVIDVARTTLTAIEKGERRIRAGELIELARAYGRQVSDFVHPRPVIEPFQVQFRGPYQRAIEDNDAIKPYIDQLEELSRNYLELEQRLEAPLVRKYPPEYQYHGSETRQVAESTALEERNRLGLGDGPISILRDLLEQDVGLRIFYLELRPSTFSAIYLYTHELGGCIAVNSLHPEERRRWSLAHDYGHFLGDRYKPTVFVEDGYQRIPESERFADYFARFFLMPGSGLMRRFNDLRRTRDKVSFADLCTLAHYYGVSVEALTRRLEEMKLLPTGIWDKLKERGLKVREAQQQLGLGPLPARTEKLPWRYQYLAVDAFNQDLITEGHFARLLQVDRLTARQIAEVLQEEESTEITSMLDMDASSRPGV